MILPRTLTATGLLLVLSALLGPVTSAGAAKSKADDGFVSMFNGKDLTGWEGDSSWWKVQAGILVAESTPQKPCRRSHYLYWKGGGQAGRLERVPHPRRGPQHHTLDQRRADMPG